MGCALALLACTFTGCDDRLEVRQAYDFSLSSWYLQEGIAPDETVEIDLERRVSIPQIVQCTVFQQITEKFVGVVTVLQTCPLVKFPSHTPSGCSVAAMLKYHSGSFGKVGCGDG